MTMPQPRAGATRIAADQTAMYLEAAEAPAAIERQFAANSAAAAALGAALRAHPPRAVVTAGRGSSDHAATFAKYLIETRTGTLTSSAAPSVSSVYAAPMKLDGVVYLAISQSGRSPDMLASALAAKDAGARVVAIVNDVTSPLAKLAHHLLPMHAGPEASVAATKTYLASVAAILQLIASWTDDTALRGELAQLPSLMRKAWTLDWATAARELTPAHNLYVVGRGIGFGAAQEAALKLKETCALHAEAFSSAEVRHGPMALIREGFPLLVFSQNDETRADIAQLVAGLVAAQATVLLAGFSHPGAFALPAIEASPLVQPLLLVQSFYKMAASLSVARGLNPDRPPNLRKITETL